MLDVKYAFTTLGCPDWDLQTIISRANEYGYDAIDFRGMGGRMALWETPEFSTNIGESAARIRDAGLEVTCISTGIKCMAPSESERSDELARSAEVAAAIGALQLRVFGGTYDDTVEHPIERMSEVLRGLAERAQSVADIEVLLETHDAWTSRKDVAQAMAGANHPKVGVCWDIKHTYWIARETPLTTWEAIGRWVRNTHWKDVRRGEASRPDRLCLVGDGQIPLADAYQVLLAGGYDGPMTLEWEKRWHPEIDDPEAAFPTFIVVMKSLADWRQRVAGG